MKKKTCFTDNSSTKNYTYQRIVCNINTFMQVHTIHFIHSDILTHTSIYYFRYTFKHKYNKNTHILQEYAECTSIHIHYISDDDRDLEAR